MKVRISQALAIRSTKTPARVTHVRLRYAARSPPALTAAYALGAHRPNARFDSVERVLRGTRLRDVEEVDRTNGLEPRSEARDVRVRCRGITGVLCRRYTARVEQPTRRERDLVVLAAARALKQLA